MFSSLYSALSGMLGFSKGLDVISNNVANMNTPGFKASELQFRDLFYRFGLAQGGASSEQVGEGVDTGSTRLNFNQGDLRESTNALDLAVDGNGFFVLRQDHRTFYTRNGQFAFNDDGILVDPASGAHVAASNGGRLADISIAGLRVSLPKRTSVVKFIDVLNSNATTNELDNVTVFDANGASHGLKLAFTKSTDNTTPGDGSGNRWTVTVKEGDTSLGTGEIRYAGAGNTIDGFGTFDLDLALKDAPASRVTFDFTGSQSFSGSSSTLRLGSQDGFAAGALTDMSFDESGVLTLKYANGQSVQRDRLALAWFDDLQSLNPAGDNRFTAKPGQAALTAAANTEGMGKISAKHLELSNVNLTSQFTDIVVIQRGYQASSQVISVANEMAQQLMDLHSRK